jgi:hypothetical protein
MAGNKEFESYFTWIERGLVPASPPDVNPQSSTCGAGGNVTLLAASHSGIRRLLRAASTFPCWLMTAS